MSKSLASLFAGLSLGLGAMIFVQPSPRLVQAASNDRFQDYILCTGAVAINPRSPTDGIWMLDYRSGKLLGTIVDRAVGKIVGWAEVDMVTEFALTPKQDVHFMMTTGSIAQGQAALYVAETTTGKFGVYTMSAAPTGQGLVITRHDMSSFRVPKPE
jgi:hypothetical protein